MFLTVCLNPVIQKTCVLENFKTGEVNRLKNVYTDASGKGINVSRVLTQLGGNTVHITQADGVLKPLLRSLTKHDGYKIKTARSKSEIRQCYTLINQSTKQTTEIVEPGYIVSKDTEKKILALASKHLKKAHTLMVSGTKAPGFSDRLYPEIVRLARSAGVFTILDLKGDDLKNCLSFSPDIVKPNLKEFFSTYLTEYQINESENYTNFLPLIKEKIRELSHGPKPIWVLTAGKHPVLFTDPSGNGDVLKVTTDPVKHPVNTTGCGDAFTAALAFYSYKEGRKNLKPDTLKKLITKSSAVAAQNALTLKPGTIL